MPTLTELPHGVIWIDGLLLVYRYPMPQSEETADCDDFVIVEVGTGRVIPANKAIAEAVREDVMHQTTKRGKR